jgi:hypothetical protein
MSESFADAPLSIGEIRAAKENDGSKWTPRDALVTMLRQIDSGEIAPDGLVICWTEASDRCGHRTHFWNATPEPIYALGLLTRVIYQMQHDAEA